MQSNPTVIKCVTILGGSGFTPRRAQIWTCTVKTTCLMLRSDQTSQKGHITPSWQEKI